VRFVLTNDAKQLSLGFVAFPITAADARDLH